ncbi:MAG TPA: hypothetical protein VF623_12360 [Segetibacter sp.]|jgi:hypothetical protein
MQKERVNTIEATDADYEKAEMDQLRDALKRSHMERFLMTTTLYKIQLTLNRAKITRTPYTLSK